jgi:hypothetical protein
VGRLTYVRRSVTLRLAGYPAARENQLQDRSKFPGQTKYRTKYSDRPALASYIPTAEYCNRSVGFEAVIMIALRRWLALSALIPLYVEATLVTNDTSVAADKTFDYVIVGAGLAGITVANKV